MLIIVFHQGIVTTTCIYRSGSFLHFLTPLQHQTVFLFFERVRAFPGRNTACVGTSPLAG
jgi:hypothetical protein